MVKTTQDIEAQAPQTPAKRRVRADAQRSSDALLKAALEVFKTSGVDAPVREIAEKAGVGIGTVYRNFPQRADLVAAVFRQEVDRCAAAASQLAAEYGPGDALAKWLQRYVDFLAAKRGLAKALHSGDPAFEALPAYFEGNLKPALESLLLRAAAAGEVRKDVDSLELLGAVTGLSMPTHDKRPDHARRMVALLVEGLRHGTSPTLDPAP
ncbi:TetR/AcrR family transcriptional regulator [Rhizobium halophytocola]|uniref:AcrR family transcriptional regulator n=1 Tax=Rhizobium halophytocola TaxID=735519 RepID=A0ABS4E5R6_9HYPH|nr:TetR/AcrR family transcriptional regulator [Rhizobium halophytocola]MBP1853287.1 AcrR family transcriptional regulator [Rhizobium halophytocola]